MIGRTLGHYRILDELGKGGMGEVYRARDEVLGRDVAIKVLPEALTQDSERLARFEREAKVLASVNHPHIGAIYGLEQDDGQRFLVLELVEGETLAASLDRHPIPVDDAISQAIQIAQALEAAHEKGVVHRDLKPANIKITPDGDVKVLDFGLAKPSEAVFQGDLTESPTLTYAPTGVGVILGTAAYMSPEQVRGQEVDKRSDIWAFGVVLWEMLTGKKLFGGDTVSDILASTLMREPEWEGLPEGLPAGVTRVLKRCLVQDPKERLHDIADARIELQEVLEEPEVPFETVVTPKPLWLRTAPWLVLPLALAMGWFLRPVPESEPVPTVRFEIPLPEGERLTHSHRHGIAWSPDGSTLAFESGTPDTAFLPERTQIQVRKLGSWETRPVPGTEFSGQPIYSPDGRWLAFLAVVPNRLRRVAVEGGEPETICECDPSYGASWGPDNSIVFGGYDLGGLQRVSAMGGTPEPFTFLDEEAGESRHSLPHHLPGGKGVLLTVILQGVSGAQGGTWNGSVHLKESLNEGGTRRVLIAEGADARYLSTGHLIYARGGSLLAVPFDLNSLEITGPEVPVLANVTQADEVPFSGFDTLAAQFGVSSSGSLAYAEGSVFPEDKSNLTFLVDRQGDTEVLEIESDAAALRMTGAPRLNRDQRRLLLTASDAWIYDLERNTLTRQTFEQEIYSGAIWGPGPDQFTFTSNRDGLTDIYWKTVNLGPNGVSSPMGNLEDVDVAWPSSWSSDGKTLALVVDPAGEEFNWDVWVYSSETGPRPFVQSRFLEWYPELSSDGQWIAYTSNESGKPEVYVRSYPDSGGFIQISVDGGAGSTWSHDGTEMFYWHPEEPKLFVVKVEAEGNRLSAGAPQFLFEGEYGGSSPIRGYDILADGRFLMWGLENEADSQAAIAEIFPDRIGVVQNWLTELEQKLPTVD